MPTKKLVSILVPTYNRDGLIKETLLSAVNQSYQNIEIIVVDNCSTDKTWDIVTNLSKQYNKIKCFRNDSNIGPVRNWQRCIDLATGYYGKILWSDDLIHQDFVLNTLKNMHDDVGFVYTATRIFEHDINSGDILYNTVNPEGYVSSKKFIEGVVLDEKYPVSPGCAIFRMKDLRENLLVNIPNKVNSDFSMHAIGNDLLIYLLTAKSYDNVYYHNELLSYFRSHDESITISSSSGKIPLHYTLAAAYFIENNERSLIRKLNSIIYFRLLRYSRNNDFGLKCISDFYVKNHDYIPDFSVVLKKIIRAIKNIRLS